MDKKLPARPNLEHLRGQAKTLLAHLKDTDPSSTLRLADAQFIVARQTGFAGWPALTRHVQQLRSLEGDWRFESLELEGQVVPAAALGQARLLIDGDRFRTESPEAIYEGIFTIDVEAEPASIDIEFVEGPDAGNTCYGIYEVHGNSLKICLGLVGATRPRAFESGPGTGHAFERLRRASADRPENVTGGTPVPPDPDLESVREDPSAFVTPMTPIMRRLEGEWVAMELISDGKPMPEEWLSFATRRMTGPDVTVTVGGQTMVHARVRLDETVDPIAIDYLQLDGNKAGTVTRGIMEWDGEDVRFAMPAAGSPRPASFDPPPAKGTRSRWRRK